MELDFPPLRTVLVFAALSSGLSNGLDAKSTELQIFAPTSSDPGRHEFFDRPVIVGGLLLGPAWCYAAGVGPFVRKGCYDRGGSGEDCPPISSPLGSSITVGI